MGRRAKSKCVFHREYAFSEKEDEARSGNYDYGFVFNPDGECGVFCGIPGQVMMLMKGTPPPGARPLLPKHHYEVSAGTGHWAGAYIAGMATVFVLIGLVCLAL